MIVLNLENRDVKYCAMKALVDVDFDGVVIADHIPTMAKDHRVGTAYSIPYMKAMVITQHMEPTSGRSP